MNLSELEALKAEALELAQDAKTAPELEAVRIRYLSRNGRIPEVMNLLKEVPPAERPAFGRIANEWKKDLAAVIERRKGEFADAGRDAGRKPFDPTMPGLWRGLGSRHPVNRIIEDAMRIWWSLGFTVADGPDIETEWHNFDALNTPGDHPSRDIQDTFWLDDGRLLRTQTSPVQIRVMERQKPPVRIIAPGRCYRRDTTDATHSANFHQIEGLYVDRAVSLAELKGDITHFARSMMGPNVKVRFRPHYFPFTEPSVEYDFSCHLCGGRGCRVCKNSGWIEISGAGLVHPKVFAAVGYDPEAVSGYAFGMGVERIAMIKYGIEDIRLLYESDVRFLEQLA